MDSIIYKRRRKLPYDSVKSIFDNVDVTKVSTVAPAEVKKHSVYVYRVTVDTNYRYWRYDGLAWENLRSHKWPKDDPHPWCKRVDHQLLVNGKKVDLIRHEYSPFGCQISPPNAWERPYVVVHYKGTFDVQTATNASHGNCKTTPMKSAAKILREIIGEPTPLKSGRTADFPIETRPTARKRTGDYRKVQAKKRKLDFGETENQQFTDASKVTPSPPGSESVVRENHESESSESQEFFTAESLLDSDLVTETNMPSHGFHSNHPNVGVSLKSKMRENKTPTQALKEVTRESIIEHGDQNPSLIPRNKKQAYYAKQQLNEEQKHDDIFEMYLFAKQHPELVLELNLIPQVIAIQSHPEMIKHVTSLQKKFETVVYHYDTTFDIGTFFTSILSMRHPLFKNEPLIPLAVMYHETTNEEAHSAFFRTISRNFGLNSVGTIIVTDREKSITNAIRTHLTDARNIYCWNHIRRNVGEWVTKRISASAASFYKQEVFSLLHAESVDDYQTKFQLANFNWDAGFYAYYQKFLEEDIQASYRPVLESIGLYNQLSGITNNPAESTNAAFKRITDMKNAGFFHALSASYFYQTDKLFDVFRGMKKQGDFVLCIPLPSGIYAAENLKDLVDPEVVSSLVMNGKIPENLCSNKNYASVSLYETTTLRGLAKFYIDNKRIEWLPKKGVFVISGLRDRNYIVSLKANTCSCLRQNTCEHKLAVFMSTGIEGKHALKRCQPSLGSIYRKTVKKATGKKKGQGSKRRLVLPKPKPALTAPDFGNAEVPSNGVTAEGGHCTTEQLVICDDTRRLPGDPVEVSRQIEGLGKDKDLPTVPVKLKTDHECIPRLNRENHTSTYLSLPTGNISLAEMKSVQHSITLAEKRLLSKLMGNSDTENWIVDSVISGFLFIISDMKNEGVVSLTAQEAFHMFQGGDTSLLFAAKDLDVEDYHSWSKIDKILIPLNKNENHWILIVVLRTSREIQVLDPIGCAVLSLSEQIILQGLFNSKFGYPENTDWNVTRPHASLSVGKEAMQCGPFICFYAEAIVKGWCLNSFPGTECYRKHIAATLIGNCSPFRSQLLKRCACCKTTMKLPESCNFCNLPAHQQCLNQVSLRGRVYFVCQQKAASSGTLLFKNT